MNLVVSILTPHKIPYDSIQKIRDIFCKKSSHEICIQEYKYDDRKFYEIDVDLLNVSMSKSNVMDEIENIISICEHIIINVEAKAEFIVANDDTDADIIKYENNNSDVKSFGLFIASRRIEGVEAYYSSKHCNAYLNFENVSFGVIF